MIGVSIGSMVGLLVGVCTMIFVADAVGKAALATVGEVAVGVT